MRLRSYNDVQQALATYVPKAHAREQAYTLTRMKQLMVLFDNPQERYKVIHIGGTSGKTSTAYYVAAMLSRAGSRVGLMTSPHVDSVGERVQINMTQLPEKEFCSRLGLFIEKIEAAKIRPTYFEVLTAFGFFVLAEEQVDYAIVEVGVGGLLDATNVISRADKVCVITDIALEHTDILGRTISTITAKKAGIIHSHNTVLMYVQDEAVMQVIREVTFREQADLHEVLSLPAKELPASLPLFQRRNWYLALSAYEFLRDRDGLAQLSAVALSKTAATYIPARMETFTKGKKTIIIDGAHNAQKLSTFAKSVKVKFPHTKRAVLFSVVHNKFEQIDESLKSVLSLADHLILCNFSTEYADQKHSVKALRLAERCESLGYHDWEIIDDPKKALKALLGRDEDVLIVVGSFYLLNHIRPLIGIKQK